MLALKDRIGNDAGIVRVRGRVSLFRIRPEGISDILVSKNNQIQETWGMIAAMAIGFGNRSYRVSGLYIEYENMGDPDDAITPPDFERSAGIEYYSDLVYSATRDYLRVPLIQSPLLGIEAGYEGIFTEGETGNKLTFFTQTQGTTGVHGKTFSDSANSKVFGVALVAIPTFQDSTKDVILARTYFDAADQVAKLPSSQIGVSWDVSFL